MASQPQAGSSTHGTATRAPPPPASVKGPAYRAYVQKCPVLLDWWLEKEKGEGGKIRVAGYTTSFAPALLLFNTQCSGKSWVSRSTFMPPTSLEQADELINGELLRLLEHDNAKYPLDEKTEKEKKKGSKRQVIVPEIEDFHEDELKEAGSMVEEEIQYLRVAMGHENESFEDFVKAHDACQEDLMFFPTNNSYGLASVSGYADKIAAMQNEFETVKKRMDDEAKKASRLEQKIKLLTQGYQARAGKLWSQIQDTFKQMRN